MANKIWEKWKSLAERIGNVTGKVVFTAFYFSLFAIPAIFLSFAYDKVGKKYHAESTYFNQEVKDIELNNIEKAREM